MFDTTGPKIAARTDSHIFVVAAAAPGREGGCLRLGGCGYHLGSRPWSADIILLVSSLFVVKVNGEPTLTSCFSRKGVFASAETSVYGAISTWLVRSTGKLVASPSKTSSR
jgi:hypothetical protein